MSRERAKGTRAETAVVDFLRAHGWPHAERRATRGHRDGGDIAGIPGVCIEIKDQGKMELGTWVNEAKIEALQADADLGMVWHKRRGMADAGGWYVTMDGATFARLLKESGR